MAYNQQNAFWDFVRSMDQSNNANNNGEGVDRPANVPGAWSYGSSFGHWPYPPPPPPPGGHSPQEPHHPPHGPGHHGHHHPPPPPPPHELGADFPFGGGLFDHHGPHHGANRGGMFGGPPRGGFHGRGGGRRGRHARREERRGERGENDHEEGEQGPWGSFDLSSLLASLAAHPRAQPYRQFFENLASQAQGQRSGETARDGVEVEEENTFTPPVDIFTTETEFVLHVALPGAKKEDVGINWDGEKSVLNVAGVIYRQGDEEFLKNLTQSERKVGVFERAVKLPPHDGGDEKDEVDGDGITAKLEDGVLVVKVPKVEKEWTDVKKVDIQ